MTTRIRVNNETARQPQEPSEGRGLCRRSEYALSTQAQDKSDLTSVKFSFCSAVAKEWMGNWIKEDPLHK